jgi:hypothetical protein
MFSPIIPWNFIITWFTVSVSFIAEYKDYIDFHDVCRYQPITPELVDRFPNRIYWYQICKKPLPEWFIEKYETVVNWDTISIHQDLSEQFIEKYIDQVNLDLISQYQKLTNKFIITNLEKLDAKLLLQNKKIKLTPELKLLIKLSLI